MEKYVPPFTITNKVIDLVANIMEKLGMLSNYTNLNKMPILRRNNRIASIHSSLAIEDNSLTIEQVKEVIDGKLVIGPMSEIQEVKNAYNAYNMISQMDPYSIDDLKQIHGVLTEGLVNKAGEYRKGNEGVFDGEKCIFMAPGPDMVPELMDELFVWISENKNIIHPLILSSIFHYEFLFIHPFEDGNGRTARLWQNIILYNWKDLFEYIPIESQIKEYQEDYYNVIAKCNNDGESTAFIEFMLSMIDEVLNKLINETQNVTIHSNTYITRLLEVMEDNRAMSANEIMDRLSIKSKENFRANYLNPAIEKDLIALTQPDKPTSKNQMYYKR